MVVAGWRLKALLAVALVATSATSGCLRDEVFPEPYAWRHGTTLEGAGDVAGRDLVVPDDAQRLRIRFEVNFAYDTPVLGPQAGARLTLRDPEGKVYMYNVSRTSQFEDTFGGDVGGPWKVSVADPGGGARHKLLVSWYVPEHEDWAWWQVWRR